jgi:hypothetical protein
MQTSLNERAKIAWLYLTGFWQQKQAAWQLIRSTGKLTAHTRC